MPSTKDGADSLAMMLRLLGNEVQTANDGMQALKQAEQFGPEVVLMDIGMPRLNGLDATRRIREQPWGRDMLIIALTGWGNEGDRERSGEAGCDGHLPQAGESPGAREAADGRGAGSAATHTSVTPLEVFAATEASLAAK